MRTHSSGFSLIELMVVVAIISIIAGIAIPAYNNYIKESQFAAAKANVEPLRLALEDYWLDNGTYADINGDAWNPATSVETLKTGDLSWQPDGDDNNYSYAVTATTNAYTIVVTHLGSSRSVSCAKSADCTYSE